MTFSFVHSRHDETMIRIGQIGLDLTVRLSRESTGGALTIIETINRPGFGPPLHRHAETEVLHILEGRYLFEIDGCRFTGECGDVITVPGGAAHAFVNIGHAPARQLVMILPGLDATAFFRGLGALMQGGMPERDKLNEFGRRWGVEFLGPPLRAP